MLLANLKLHLFAQDFGDQTTALPLRNLSALALNRLEAIREIIDRIVITPGPTRRDLTVTLQGELGTILNWIERTGKPGYKPAIDTRSSQLSVSVKTRAGLRLINFTVMPLLDWVRTGLDTTLESGAEALGFDIIDFAVFDVFLLQRPGAADELASKLLAAAEHRYTTTPRALGRASAHADPRLARRPRALRERRIPRAAGRLSATRNRGLPAKPD
ncbi:mannonate dehydratase [Mesorhizobium sp. CAU 1732]|uniref:mannonate dehydratase n=1 Tax=Mesorhizobium sp. CAU 1732 TaxID=3140358 RepID=UPI0032613ED1